MNDPKPQGKNMSAPENSGQNPAPRKTGGLNSEIQARIGHQLRAMYDDVVRQGVPDRFAELIRKLDEPAAGAGVAKEEGTD